MAGRGPERLVGVWLLPREVGRELAPTEPRRLADEFVPARETGGATVGSTAGRVIGGSLFATFARTSGDGPVALGLL